MLFWFSHMRVDKNVFSNEKKTIVEVKIPLSLQQKDFRFIILRKNKKTPLETGWRDKKNYAFDSPKFLCAMRMGFNYAVLGGEGGINILDIDSKEFYDEIFDKLPNTFMVQSSKKFKIHVYFIIPDLINGLDINKGDKHFGELRSLGQYVVGGGVDGCGSTHPSGCKYAVINSSQILRVTKEKLFSLLGAYVVSNQKKLITGEKDLISDKKRSSKILVKNYDFRDKNKFRDLCMSDFKKDFTGKFSFKSVNSAGFCMCLSPVHYKNKDSVGHGEIGTMGVKFITNTWFCFQHHMGSFVDVKTGKCVKLTKKLNLSAWSWLAVKEGLLLCEDVTFDNVRSIFRKLCKIAKEKYGYDRSEEKRKFRMLQKLRGVVK